MITQTVSKLLQDHVTLEIECMDRIYLNAYQPMLQTGGGVSVFFRQHRGAQVASSVLMAPMSTDFVKRIRCFAREEGLEIERFQKGVRKDEVTQTRLADFRKDEGALYIGVAQEKSSTFRTLKKLNPETGLSLAVSLNGDVQPILLLPGGCRFWPIVYQVLELLPVYGADLPEWT